MFGAEQTSAQVILQMQAARRRSWMAEADHFQLAATYADLHSHVDEHPVALPGQERLVQLGGDGTPEVAEFAPLDLAAALNVTVDAARVLIADALSLRHRLPGLWTKVSDGFLRVGVARRLVQLSIRLPLARARELDRRLVPLVEGVTAGRLLTIAEGLVADLMPDELARDEQQRAFDSRGVWIRDSHLGITDLDAKVTAADGVYLDAQLNRMAGILAQGGDTTPHQVRRSTALGVLATPVLALQLLQHSLLDEPLPADALVDPMRSRSADLSTEPPAGHDDDLGGPATRGPGEWSGPVQPGGATILDAAMAAGVAQLDPECPALGLRGHTCGRVTVDPAKLLPTATVVVHIDQNTLAEADGVARIEGVGPIMADHLCELLERSHVRLLPMVDARAVVPSDCYEISRRTRLIVQDRNPVEVFPGSKRPASRCDLDHTEPFTGPPAVTAIEPMQHEGWRDEGCGSRPPQPPRGCAALDDLGAQDHHGAADPHQHMAQRSRPRGQTRPDNLGPLSRTVHRAKTHGGWQVKQLFDGIFVWQSPDGFAHLVTPTRSWLIHAPGALAVA